MRRNERERQARKETYVAAKNNYWTPKDMTLEAYFDAVKQHPPVAEILETLDRLRVWKEGDDFEFVESKNGICEKCGNRGFEQDPTTELKAAPKCMNGSADVQFNRYAAEQFAKGKEPIILSPNLHRDFVYHSWVEVAHLDHIKEHRDEPGIVAVEAHPEIEPDGKMSLALGIRAIDGSHRAALTYRDGKPFAVRVLTPVETLKSMFAINNKKNPFFALKYSPVADKILKMIACGELGPHLQL